MLSEVQLQQHFYDDFLQSLLEGNRGNCSLLVKHFLSKGMSIPFLYENVLKNSLYDVGLLWEHNKIGVATEHMATAITESILNELYPEIISSDRIQKAILLSCVENEHHQVGIKMVADMFEMYGWDTYFIGANTPAFELIRFAKESRISFIAISLSVYFNIPYLENMLREIEEDMPETRIIVGGQAFLHGASKLLQEFPKVLLLADLPAVEKYLENTQVHND